MSRQPLCIQVAETTLYRVHHRRSIWKIMQCNMALVIFSISVMMDIQELIDFRKTLKMTPAEIRESVCPLSWRAQMQKVIDAIKTKDK
jgi:hypothetical protein